MIDLPLEFMQVLMKCLALALCFEVKARRAAKCNQSVSAGLLVSIDLSVRINHEST